MPDAFSDATRAERNAAQPVAPRERESGVSDHPPPHRRSARPCFPSRMRFFHLCDQPHKGVCFSLMIQQVAVTDSLLQAMTAEIVRAVNPERVILFGSHARGTAAPDSDIDLLIVEDEPFTPQRSRTQEMARVFRLLDRFRVATDIVVFSRDEIEHWRNSLNHLIGRAFREGRILYARS